MGNIGGLYAPYSRVFLTLSLLLFWGCSSAAGITFSELPAEAGIGAYERTPSPRAVQNQVLIDGTLPSGASVFCRDAIEAAIPGAFDNAPVVPLVAGFACQPLAPRGVPGTCIFDYDDDGDEDFYVTNGPGSSNSLFANQFAQTGVVTFIDVAAQAGVQAQSQDSSGCVAADLDNDGDQELFVLGMASVGANTAGNVLFDNNGDGSFAIAVSGAEGSASGVALSSTLADVDADGLLDIFISHAAVASDLTAIYLLPTERNQKNQLYLNQGGLSFTDVSDTSGIRDLAGMRVCPEPNVACDIGEAQPIAESISAGFSWATAAADIDLDGDIDIMTGDDQAAVPDVGSPVSPFEGVPNSNRGLVHVHLNDGEGGFTDQPAAIDRTGAAPTGSWMGISYCDYNHDGHMDFFGSNFGDVNLSAALGAPLLGVQPSRWFLGNGDGTFVDSLVPGGPLPGIGATPFGWGSASIDYDNDGDCDVVFTGNIFPGGLVTLDNPIAVYENDGDGNFTGDTTILTDANRARHQLRVKHAMAAGDFNDDGFADIVTVSNTNIPASTLEPGPNGEPPLTFANPFNFGGPWDTEALVSAYMAPCDFSAPAPGSKCEELAPDADDLPPIPYLETVIVPGPGGPIVVPDSYPNGDVSVEISSGNANQWIKVDTAGSIGIIQHARVNRDGIGAVVQVTPVQGFQKGRVAMQPVVAGSGRTSQHSEVAGFGLGDLSRATIDVLWPGGVRNRLHRVPGRQTVLFPEIPCSIDTDSSLLVYQRCVRTALEGLVDADVLGDAQARRFSASAFIAYLEER